MNKDLQDTTGFNLLLKYLLPLQLQPALLERKPIQKSDLEKLIALAKQKELSQEQIVQILSLIEQNFPEEYYGLMQISPKNPFAEETVRSYFPEIYNKSIRESKLRQGIQTLMAIQHGKAIRTNHSRARIHYRDIITREDLTRVVDTEFSGMPREGDYVSFVAYHIVEANVNPYLVSRNRDPKAQFCSPTQHHR